MNQTLSRFCSKEARCLLRFADLRRCATQLRRARSEWALVGALCVLSACGDTSVKDTLGLTRTAPDEFTVVSRPALTVPPDFTLRPPHAGEGPRVPTPDETAHGLLLGKAPVMAQDPSSMTQPTVDTAVAPVVTTSTPTPAESSFLKRVGAGEAKDDIRDTLNADQNAPVDNSQAKSLLEKVTGDEKQEPTVDAKKEAERLRANKDEGKAATEGDTPDEVVKKPTILDRIF